MSLTRTKSHCGIYHVVIRGVNRQVIFDTDDDCRRFLKTLKTNAEDSKMEVYAWCLMGNHVHLLIKEGEETISDTMLRIEVSYVKYFNIKNERVGPLFQGRFFSKTVETEAAFWRVYKYIALNPVKAGLARSPESYMWSWLWMANMSTNFTSKVPYERPMGVTPNPWISVIDDFTEKEIDYFEMEGLCRPIGTGILISDEEAAKMMGRLTGYKSTSEIQKLEIRDRDVVVKILLEARISPMQISRITGINRTLIYRIKKRM